jgi:threonine/homoserine/homoserine lactone efflux protein
MTGEGALGLILASAVFAAVPGPGVTAIVGQAVARGLRPALIWTLGIVLGDVLYMTLVLLGLTWTARELGDVFVVLKWLGAGYLIFLGLRCLFARSAPAAESEISAPANPVRAFFGGLFVSLGNPKVMAFYCGFLPGFVDLQHLSVADTALVVALVLCTVLAVLAAYAWLGARGKTALSSPRAWKTLNRGAGVVMIGAGAAVAAN